MAIAHRAMSFGALRSASPITAPIMRFDAAGRQPKVDLRAGCSPVDDQRPLGSCNACSVVGALEYLGKKKNGVVTELSVLFLYYNARKLSDTQNEDAGCITAHAPAAIMAYGICEDRLWPYKTDRFTQKPPDEAYNNARVQAVEYARITTTEEVKVSLSNGTPVIVGWDMPAGYYDAAKDTGKMPDAGSFAGEPEGHSMLVVGYDDTEKMWLVRNSWGPTWGDHGYVRIPYGLADKHAWGEEMWVIGELYKPNVARLVGASMEESVRDTRARAVEQTSAALAALKKDLRKDLQENLDDAKKSIRDRLRGQMGGGNDGHG